MFITAYYFHLAGGVVDVACEKIFESFGGQFYGSGTTLDTGERDVEYEVPDGQADACIAALTTAGHRVEVNEYSEE